MKKITIFLLCFYSNLLSAQNTMGAVSIAPDVFDGYTLFTAHTKTYLLNNCGALINEWDSEYLPGNAVYLLPNGNLLRAGQVDDDSSNITFGGQGGIVELFDWDGQLLWSKRYNSNSIRQHHDVFPMPNGNILILAATVITNQEAIDLGRDPSKLTEGRLYNERIFEIEPVGTDAANVVWEWNIQDHLVQDFDAQKSNFGNVAMSPKKLDVNFLNAGNGASNWLHFNSIQYDETLDQIVISSRNLSEIYIIDHSISTIEAATTAGDFLYRWGNPQAYRQGLASDRKLFGQHSPYYIQEGLEDAGKLMLYNNGNGRTPLYSEVLILDPPTTAPGVYDYSPNTAFGPIAADYSYADLSATPSPFYSGILSSAQRLPNGNILVCEGINGEIFEINANDELVWKYINPINTANGSPGIQGNPPPSTNLIFRAKKYAPDFPAFVGRDLTPGQALEQNPNSICNDLGIASHDFQAVEMYPNPTSGQLYIRSTHPIESIKVYSLLGALVSETRSFSKSINLSDLNAGIYICQINTGTKRVSKKIIKH
ncbi:T9SS type A sorting domain-containing protein [Subsaximicrobium wynnwilliamsii]|uniref:T9SS type A sorting domain-containing protein n=1 Tax=Subsaximicrobium wynnwilliamsii TaxID=291179 RepID=A0A5C6ZDG5_9FLAO|nr:aryl-sulfate sulfotransferase [Subsaximicrobium wynnwilliamsii]TXD82295.1 T9SS type A sorting domain-containing protein [Subsaximicrobium wynnwilliamsii]TXD87933.1 T9SS type A sorting domain-containing protein [Subsaximicrobium wynnwilliamsii]TXE01926.1 T9SS type A sorting domain-containing protein [Subsaximicrobium wynnwilliamsii]